MRIENIVLLKEAPKAIGGSPSRDLALGELSDGVLLAEAESNVVSLGLYVELIHQAGEHGAFKVELIARDIESGATWWLAERNIDVPAVPADPDWTHPLNIPLPFEIVLRIDQQDMDVLLIVTINENPDALKTLFLRPALPPARDS